jgi:hypothetical protein
MLAKSLCALHDERRGRHCQQLGGFQIFRLVFVPFDLGHFRCRVAHGAGHAAKQLRPDFFEDPGVFGICECAEINVITRRAYREARL